MTETDRQRHTHTQFFYIQWDAFIFYFVYTPSFLLDTHAARSRKFQKDYSNSHSFNSFFKTHDFNFLCGTSRASSMLDCCLLADFCSKSTSISSVPYRYPSTIVAHPVNLFLHRHCFLITENRQQRLVICQQQKLPSQHIYLSEL